jgi:hypothetical protein
MSYVWETDNLVKEFTLSGGLFKPKHTVHAVQGVSLYQSPGETLGIEVSLDVVNPHLATL